jgi:hypothetical protein
MWRVSGLGLKRWSKLFSRMIQRVLDLSQMVKMTEGFSDQCRLDLLGHEIAKRRVKVGSDSPIVLALCRWNVILFGKQLKQWVKEFLESVVHPWQSRTIAVTKVAILMVQTFLSSEVVDRLWMSGFRENWSSQNEQFEVDVDLLGGFGSCQLRTARMLDSVSSFEVDRTYQRFEHAGGCMENLEWQNGHDGKVGMLNGGRNGFRASSPVVASQDLLLHIQP